MKTQTKDNIKTKLPFIVESGNWKAKVLCSPVDDELNEYSYVEACTRAFEFVFGRGTNDEVQLLSLRDRNNKEYIDVYYSGDNPESDTKYNFPEATFGVFVICRLEDDENKKDKWWYTNSSTIFKNAAQTKYVAYAEEMEHRFRDTVDKLEKEKKKKKQKKS
jgi:hypothetical protein